MPGRPGPGHLRLAGRAPAPAPRLVPVERTWFRLAGLLAGPAPTDPDVLAAVLGDHRTALARWRAVLLGPARVRRSAHAVAVPV